MKISKASVAVLIGAITSLATVAVNADDSANNISSSTTPATTTMSDDSPFYRAHEFSIDGFASGSLGQQYINHISNNTLRHHARLGAGVGVNYFFLRYLGIGGDMYSENTSGPFIDSASGNLIARLPIGNTGLAPYAFGGAGHEFDQVQQTFGQAGGGLEFRVTRYLGIFADARYVFPDKTKDYGLVRAGVRVSF